MSSAACRIAQLSDLHLSSGLGGLSKGVDCWAQLRRMLEHLGGQPTVDGIVFTGDIAHDESRETYERLRDILNQTQWPYWLVPGNHDDPVLMREIFSTHVNPDLPGISFSTVLKDVVVLGLDTHEPGSAGGRLSKLTLEWFNQQCINHRGRSILVFMHHPPLNTGDAFFDSIGLAERESFWDNIRHYPQIKAVGFGHLHRPLQLHQKPWVQGAPSAAFSMEKTQDGWDVQPEGAGYLVWSVSEREVKIEVLGRD